MGFNRGLKAFGTVHGYNVKKGICRKKNRGLNRLSKKPFSSRYYCVYRYIIAFQVSRLYIIISILLRDIAIYRCILYNLK